MDGARSLDVERARRAYEAVYAAGQNPAISRKELGTRLGELPAMLRSHGLGQTFAFCMAQSNKTNRSQVAKAYKATWQMLAQVLLPDAHRDDGSYPSQNEVIRWLKSRDSRTDRQALTEALAYATWLKRWDEVLLVEGGTTAQTEPSSSTGQDGDKNAE
jgi:CRISPR type III-B/RAMP module-associated protein Cmr5